MQESRPGGNAPLPFMGRTTVKGRFRFRFFRFRDTTTISPEKRKRKRPLSVVRPMKGKDALPPGRLSCKPTATQ